jgi:hypothetical protein
MITDEQLDEWDAKEKEATAGPWAEYSAPCCPDMGGVSSGSKGAICAHTISRIGHPMMLEDAEFCAMARTAVPVLIAELRQLRAERERDIAAAVRAEREACASVADATGCTIEGCDYEVGEAIRSRGDS